jgi:hypothetical protein
VGEASKPENKNNGPKNTESVVSGADEPLKASPPYQNAVKASNRKKLLRRIMVAGICLLPLAFGLFIYFFENHASDYTAAKVHVWIQFLTSNWPNYSEHLDRRSPWFAFIVMVRFAIVYATVAGVISVFLKILNWQREATLRLADIVRERDLAIEICLLNALQPADPSDTRQKIRAGIKKADEAWQKDILPARVGKEMAQKYLEK